MSTESDHKLPQPPRGQRGASAVDKRTVRRVGARIFADLLSRSTRGAAPLSSPPHSSSSVEDITWSRSGDDTLPIDHTAAVLQMPASQTGKETRTMKAYRTESRYYFSSRQLLPVGSLVFFSHKIQRYVHPTDGILRDPHPRLQELSEGESQELEAHWQKALARY